MSWIGFFKVIGVLGLFFFIATMAIVFRIFWELKEDKNFGGYGREEAKAEKRDDKYEN